MKLSLYQHFTNTLIFSVVGEYQLFQDGLPLTDIRVTPLFTLCGQLPSYSSSGPPKSSSWWTARRSVCFLLLHSVEVPWSCHLCGFLAYTEMKGEKLSLQPDNIHLCVFICIFSTGLEGLVGRRCLLASPVLHHPAGDHGAAAALCQQPKVRVCLELGLILQHQTISVISTCQQHLISGSFFSSQVLSFSSD